MELSTVIHQGRTGKTIIKPKNPATIFYKTQEKVPPSNQDSRKFQALDAEHNRKVKTLDPEPRKKTGQRGKNKENPNFGIERYLQKPPNLFKKMRLIKANPPDQLLIYFTC